MRKFLIGLVLLSVAVCSGETIRLKNGRSIAVDSVRELDGKIEYQIGDNTYRIPKSLVEKIDSSVPPLSKSDTSTAAATTEATPATAVKPVPATPSVNSAEELRVPRNDISLRVVHDGKVDLDILNQIESSGNANSAAAGYFLAGRFEYEAGNREQARHYFERALGYAPDNAAILVTYAANLIQIGHGRDAINYAEHAVQVAPSSPDALSILGYAYFTADRARDAISPWEKSLELRPDEKLQALVEKTKRELSVEANFTEHDTGRFTLRYEGSIARDNLRQQIVGALDQDYDQLSADLGIVPYENIPVILYTEKEFFDVTQAPTWTGAINDGKLRIPVRGVDYITPQLARVLKHELTHSFINQAAAGRCPQWLNEGIAQMEEGRTLDNHGSRLAQLYKQHSQIPLQALEGSFMKFSTSEALISYDESLAGAMYIRDTYGVLDLRRLVERSGQSGSFEQALTDVLHVDYAHFELDLGDYLSSKYGSNLTSSTN
ncbi:MAG TPA: tetratricopeptide repeat protein [Terriglobales bacterium]|nr:tetratricopeptide repeat protein [Terriglobales bacterium]